jgi:hypothetical protein
MEAEVELSTIVYCPVMLKIPYAAGIKHDFG